MEITDKRIDSRKAFDWGKTSKEYAKYESWHGRMKACRGVGASLSSGKLAKWDVEHRVLLDEIASNDFEVLHYAALAVLRKKTC